jgi:predicted O-methyltransferase YrrM
MNFIQQDIEKYAEAHTTPENELLKKITRETHLEVLQPRMLSGHLQGRLLSMFSKMIEPKNILEIGTYTGYSALCLAEGLTEEGKLVTLDKNIELFDRVNTYFSESQFRKKLKMLHGDALELIPNLKESWDLVFIDADKENYYEYYKMTLPHVRSGGYIIADNVLWSGKVIDSSADDADTMALRAFNSALLSDVSVEVILLPIRDGLTVARKK